MFGNTNTLIALILDRSGSMAGRVNDVIGGVNAFIESQKSIPGEATLAMVRFDQEYEEFRPALPLAQVMSLQPHEYSPRGSTALLDAVGRAIHSLDAALARYRAGRAIVVVVTDGEENASREFTKERVQALIKEREARGWTFIYLGAHANAFHEAATFGFSANNTAQYANTTTGTAAAYSTLSASIRAMRVTGSSDAKLGGVIDEKTP
jgi:uncharacterized protein YegL